MRLIHQRSPRPYRQVAAGKGWRNGPALPCLACFSAFPCFHYACLLLCTCPACFHGSCLPCFSASLRFPSFTAHSCFLAFLLSLHLPYLFLCTCFACLSVLALPFRRRFSPLVAQVSFFPGAGPMFPWRRSDFLAGTCSTVLHRMAKCGAGPDLFCRPAPAGDVADLR